jgi:hypothetical protein
LVALRHNPEDPPMSMKKKGFHRPPFPDDRITLKSEHIHDPYRPREKLEAGTVCPDCGAVVADGRWTWGARAEGAPEARCQACRRIHDRYPAGELTLEGPIVATHRDEILRMLRHEAAEERAEHPLHRLIAIEERPEALVVTTTDTHLPRRLGHALERAFKGRLDLHYDEQACFVRGHWRHE